MLNESLKLHQVQRACTHGIRSNAPGNLVDIVASMFLGFFYIKMILSLEVEEALDVSE